MQTDDKQQLSAVILFFCQTADGCFSPLTFTSHKGDGEAKGTGGNTTEHETQLHLFSQTWNSPLVLGSPSWSELAVHRPQTRSFPLFDCSQILSHCRGFGTRISAQMGFELIWTHVGIFCGVRLTEIFNMSDCPDLSPRTLTLSTDTSANYPEASCGGKQEHLARGRSKSASVILFWVWWVTLLCSQRHFSPSSMESRK